MIRGWSIALLKSAMWHALVPVSIGFAVTQTYVLVKSGNVGADAHAYWLASNRDGPLYGAPPTYRDAYLYAPIFAQAIWPVAQLPWPFFFAIWALLQLAALVWLLRPLPALHALAVAGFLWTEVLLGNIFLFFAAALVLAVRGKPEALLLTLFTKVTCGVGVLWFLVRRDWAALVRILLAGAVVLGLSAAFDPQAWVDWIRFLADNAGSGTGAIAARLVVSATIVWIAARLGRPWPLAFATYLACPLILAFNPLAVLAATPRLAKQDALSRQGSEGHRSVDTASQVSDAGRLGRGHAA